MTRKQTLDAIRALGLVASYDGDSEEYRVAYSYGFLAGGRTEQQRQKDWQERSAYYTDDKDDALGTAKHMAANMQKYRS